jgi:hypothetical protein
MKRCEHCGEWFAPRYPKLKLCFSCFRKRERALAEYDSLLWELRLLRDENARLRTKAGAVPADMIGKLIRLCHPDKHGGSAMANDVTRWLLEQRN